MYSRFGSSLSSIYGKDRVGMEKRRMDGMGMEWTSKEEKEEKDRQEWIG